MERRAVVSDNGRVLEVFIYYDYNIMGDKLLLDFGAKLRG